ncbi:hypothetical protein [uncultured Bacteroides sp.]|uniref:hypothetical protein n=1 Tax=uncultured Bacteroides sp. TaxID=162156 RepID=UPI002AA73134|nr:hypothetical protein [uncultured Bacteroides sp.]
MAILGKQIEVDTRNDVLYFVRNLQDFEKDKAIRSGLASAATVFKTGGRARLRKRILDRPHTKSGKNTGNLLNSMTSFVYRIRPGAAVGFRRGENGGNHAHLVDLGTKPRRHPLTGTSGIMPANKFWTDTSEQDSPKAYNKLSQGVQRAVDRINNRR